MNLLTWLMRARRWSERPPSAARVALVLGVIAACALLFALERWLGWPEALTAERIGRMPR